MADSERTTAALQALLANNDTGNISPQDLRDMLASVFGGYGCIALNRLNAPATVAADTNFTLVDVADTVLDQSVDAFTGGVTASLVNASLTVGQTGVYHVGFAASVSSSQANVTARWAPHVNGTEGLIETQRRFSNNDVGSLAFAGIVPYTAGQSIDIRVALSAGTATLTFYAWSLYMKRVG